MTKSANERFYDTEVAPALLELAQKCQARGMPFLAVAEYRPGDFGSTQVLLDKSDTLLMAWMAQRSHTNIDKLAMSWGRHWSERGHGSIVLSQLGFPTAGEKPDTPQMGPIVTS